MQPVHRTKLESLNPSARHLWCLLNVSVGHLGSADLPVVLHRILPLVAAAIGYSYIIINPFRCACAKRVYAHYIHTVFLTSVYRNLACHLLFQAVHLSGNSYVSWHNDGLLVFSRSGKRHVRKVRKMAHLRWQFWP